MTAIIVSPPVDQVAAPRRTAVIVTARSSGGGGGGGAQGAQGAIGAQGAAGSTGAQGDSGAQGSIGAQGATGATGSNGAQGNTGAQGATGAAGSNGAQGSTGAGGATGAQGAAGSNGAQGATGATGSQGAVGAQGAAGGTGAQGAAGSNGATGAQGAAGSNGAQGAAGATGAQGAAGSTGSQGAAGATGAQGAAGSTGSQGAAGSTGAQGAAGSNGAQGATGTQGATGAQGSTGAQGATGAQGGTGVVSATAPVLYDGGTKIVSLDHGTGASQVPLNSDLRSLVDGTGTTANTATTGQVAVDVNADGPPMDSLRFTPGERVIAVRLATVAALPTVTYANGTLGVGATLTASSNGALADIDYVTPVLNDLICVRLQAAAEQNGIYKVTTLGDGSNPFVLTRVLAANEAAEFTANQYVFVAAGDTMAGAWLRSKSGSGATMGTTAIRYDGARRAVTAADIGFGMGRDLRLVSVDFEELITTITANNTKIPGTSAVVLLSGTGAQASQDETSDLVPGVCKLETGTTTTGYCCVISNAASTVFSTSKPQRFYGRAKIATASDGTNTFRARIGFFDFTSLSSAQSDGLYFQMRSGANYECIARLSGTETLVDTGIAQTTGYRSFAIYYDEITGIATFWLGTTKIATTIATNIPSGAGLIPGAHILKSAGASSRTFAVDLMTAVMPDTRSLPILVP